MSKRWRCYFCNKPHGREFAASRPECPSCNAVPPAVIPLIDVHWFPVVAAGHFRGEMGQHIVACQPSRRRLGLRHEHFSVTTEVGQVTCPKCQASPEFKRALAEAIERDDLVLPSLLGG